MPLYIWICSAPRNLLLSQHYLQSPVSAYKTVPYLLIVPLVICSWQVVYVFSLKGRNWPLYIKCLGQQKYWILHFKELGRNRILSQSFFFPLCFNVRCQVSNIILSCWWMEAQRRKCHFLWVSLLCALGFLVLLNVLLLSEVLNLTFLRGTEIWRIENFEPVLVPKSEHGKFYMGDTYIVLQVWDFFHCYFPLLLIKIHIIR